MRNPRNPSGKGRASGAARNVALAGLALGTLVFAGFWPKAHATQSEEAQLAALLHSPMPEHRKAQLIERLRKIDSSEARADLENLADATDDRLACLALRALSRSDFDGARTKIAGVFESTGRSDLTRAMALILWTARRSKDGASWADIKDYVKSHAGQDQVLNDVWASGRAKLWPNEGD